MPLPLVGHGSATEQGLALRVALNSPASADDAGSANRHTRVVAPNAFFMCLIIRRPPDSPWPISPIRVHSLDRVAVRSSQRLYPDTLPETQDGNPCVAYHGSTMRTRVCLAFRARLRSGPCAAPDARSKPSRRLGGAGSPPSRSRAERSGAAPG